MSTNDVTPFSVVFIHHDGPISPGLEGAFDIDFANTTQDLEKILHHKQVAVLVLDYQKPSEQVKSILKYVSLKYPLIRVIIRAKRISGAKMIDLVNTGTIDHVVASDDEFADIAEIIREQMQKYRGEYEFKLYAFEDLKQDYKSELKHIYRRLNRSLSDLNRAGKFKENLTRVVLDKITYYRRTIELLREDHQNKQLSETISDILLDLEFTAMEFGISNIKMLVDYQQAILALIRGDNARFHQELKTMLDSLDKSKTRKNYELLRSMVNLSQDLDHKKLGESKNYAFDLLQLPLHFDIKAMIAEDFELMRRMEMHADLEALIVIKNQVPVFRYLGPNASGGNYDPDLISSFVSALSMFSEDIFSSIGSLNAISHDLGVVLIQKASDELIYLAIVSSETLMIRLGLRHFVESTINFFDMADPNVGIPPDNEFLAREIEKNFLKTE